MSCCPALGVPPERRLQSEGGKTRQGAEAPAESVADEGGVDVRQLAAAGGTQEPDPVTGGLRRRDEWAAGAQQLALATAQDDLAGGPAGRGHPPALRGPIQVQPRVQQPVAHVVVVVDVRLGAVL